MGDGKLKILLLRLEGLTLVEVLIGIALLIIIFGGLYGAFQLGLKVVGQSKAQVTAIALANQKIEEIRNLSYQDIGTIGGIPQGVIPETETLIRNHIEYTIKTTVLYIDDPFDGLSPDDLLPTDYKRARVKVSWSGFFGGEVILITDIAPKGVETEEGGGTLKISVFNAQGERIPQAEVHIVNNQVSPTIDASYQTDTFGSLVIAGAPTSTEGYEITVTKPGFSQDRTYSREEIANPIKPHLSVFEGQVTQASFSIDQVSTFSIETRGRESFDDDFGNWSKISDSSNITISQGEVKLTTSQGETSWWDANWPKRRPITISYWGATLYNYQVKVEVIYDSDMKPDFADLRFTDENQNPLSFWLESFTLSSEAIFWVRIPSIPDGGTTIYLYYGNPEAFSLSDGSATFEWFEDFESYSLGNLNGQGGWVSPSESCTFMEVKTEAAFEGSQGVKTDNHCSSAQRDLNLGANKLLDVRINLTYLGNNNGQTTQDYQIIVKDDQGWARVQHRGYISTENWGYSDSRNGELDTGVPKQTNTWYRVKFGLYDSNKIDFWIDDTLVLQGVIVNIQTLGAVKMYNDENARGYFDLMFVRNYQGFDLSGTIGEEEDYTPPAYLNSGYLISVEIAPSNLINWDRLIFNDEEPEFTNISYQILYATDTTFELIPDEDLPGNSTGFDLSPVDLSGLDITRYWKLKIIGILFTDSSSATPILFDWHLIYNTPLIGNIPFHLQGSKIIGTDLNDQPVLKYSKDHLSEPSGYVNISALEWDSYSFSATTTTGLELVETRPSPQPIDLFPGTTTQVSLYFQAENTLLVKVEDASTTEPIFGASVRVFNQNLGYDNTKPTDENGLSYFIPLEEAFYQIEVWHQDYQPATTSVSVSGDTVLVVELLR